LFQDGQFVDQRAQSLSPPIRRTDQDRRFNTVDGVDSHRTVLEYPAGCLEHFPVDGVSDQPAIDSDQGVARRGGHQQRMILRKGFELHHRLLDSTTIDGDGLLQIDLRFRQSARLKKGNSGSVMWAINAIAIQQTYFVEASNVDPSALDDVSGTEAEDAMVLQSPLSEC